MNTWSTIKLLEVCERAARAAGTHALNNLDRNAEVSEHFEHDVKLVLDIECQQVAEGVIGKIFPDHAILGEEGSSATGHEYEWIIDPIDGTANYARGFPYWCSVVGVRLNQTMLAGCVYVPVLKECYTATADGPAFCNGKPIHVTSVSQLSEAAFFSGLTKDIDPRASAFFCDMAPRVKKLRLIGSAGIDICHVACGRSDGYFEAALYRWDVAAPGLIAERAGATVTEWPRDEPHGIRYLCTNPQLHNTTKSIVETYFSEQPGEHH